MSKATQLEVFACSSKPRFITRIEVPQVELRKFLRVITVHESPSKDGKIILQASRLREPGLLRGLGLLQKPGVCSVFPRFLLILPHLNGYPHLENAAASLIWVKKKSSSSQTDWTWTCTLNELVQELDSEVNWIHVTML
jgi:hypothetical protein